MHEKKTPHRKKVGWPLHLGKRHYHAESAQPMVFIPDGCSFHCAHIWRKSGILNFLKAFGYIVRIVKSDFFLGKEPFYIIGTQIGLSFHVI